MRILLLRTWIMNIGNGFIDKGAKACLQSAFPDAEVIETSGHAHASVDREIMSEPANVAKDLLGDSPGQGDQRRNKVFDITTLHEDIDIAVLPGHVLTEATIRRYLPTLRSLSRRNIPILLLGAGGSYGQDEIQYIRNKIPELNIQAMITRDSHAYDLYSSMDMDVYDGIDCAFFIDDWYTPPTTDTDYSTHTFDKIDEPNIGNINKIIRPDHTPFDDALFGPAWKIINSLGGNRRTTDFGQENVFVSDLLEDYLFLYANTTVCHSDRIHACVPSLAYGNKAKFHYTTERARLFDRVMNQDIRNCVVSLDEKRISEEKEHQVDKVEKLVSSLI